MSTVEEIQAKIRDYEPRIREIEGEIKSLTTQRNTWANVINQPNLSEKDVACATKRFDIYCRAISEREEWLALIESDMLRLNDECLKLLLYP